MQINIILAGVGGQGVLSIAAVIAHAAVAEGLPVRQSEVHGMAQRGGAVLAHLRISDQSIASDLVPQGVADLIISLEPLESLRYTEWLRPEGAIVTATDPVQNITPYPELSTIIEAIRTLPRHRIVPASVLAKQAGSAKSVNMVMVGAASPFLPIRTESLEQAIQSLFAGKGEALITANTAAFFLGRDSDSVEV
jgi:indolepyruvate ferredoxin oxidoreductase beta subunit